MFTQLAVFCTNPTHGIAYHSYDPETCHDAVTVGDRCPAWGCDAAGEVAAIDNLGNGATVYLDGVSIGRICDVAEWWVSVHYPYPGYAIGVSVGRFASRDEAIHALVHQHRTFRPPTY